MRYADGPKISHEILAYLDKHPEAQDTLEGIVDWWLLEQHIERQIEGVREALAELVAQGLVLESKGKNTRVHYRLNRRRAKATRALINKQNEESRSDDS
jgi:hypothetical protein